MTSVFSLSYFIRSAFMITESKLSPQCCNGYFLNNATSTQLTDFYLLYLSQLPITDCVPILVILMYHMITMRDSKVYEVPVEAKREAKIERLYSFEETETEADERNSVHQSIDERFLSVASGKKSKAASPPKPSRLDDRKKSMQASDLSDNTIDLKMEDGIVHHGDDFYNTHVHPNDISMSSSFLSQKSDDEFNYEKARKQSGWLRNSSD